MPFSPLGHVYKRLSSHLHKKGCVSFNARDLSLTFMAVTPPYSAENGIKRLFFFFFISSLSVFKENQVVIICIYHHPPLGGICTAEVGVGGPVLLNLEAAPFLS